MSRLNSADSQWPPLELTRSAGCSISTARLIPQAAADGEGVSPRYRSKGTAASHAVGHFERLRANHNFIYAQTNGTTNRSCCGKSKYYVPKAMQC